MYYSPQMVSAGRLHLSLLILVLLIVSATLFYAPYTPTSEATTSNVAEPGYGTAMHFFQPPSSYEIYGDGQDLPSQLVASGLQEASMAVVQDKLDLEPGQVAYSSGYLSESNGASYAYLKQRHDGVPFVNAVANVVIKNGKIMSFGSSFVKTDKIASRHPTIRASSAIRTAEHAFRAPHNGVSTKLGFYAQWDGSVSLVHIIQVQDTDPNADTDVWLEVYVDAHSGEVLSSISLMNRE